jgi:hypothetical protein
MRAAVWRIRRCKQFSANFSSIFTKIGFYRIQLLMWPMMGERVEGLRQQVLCATAETGVLFDGDSTFPEQGWHEA